MKRSFGLLTAAVALTLMAAAPRAMAQDATPRSAKVGYLSCHVARGFGIIIASSRDLACTFTSADGKAVENYTGEISKFGADIGYLQSGVILWELVAPANTTAPGALAGPYAGATASATVGLGGGVDALTGGLHGSIALQPISIEGNTGLNVAAGVATMNLEYAMSK
jgi:Protein of unknown function (DUF992)